MSDHEEREWNAEEFVSFIGVLSEAAAAKTQTQDTDHTNCTIEGCSYKRLATIRANSILVDQLREDFQKLDQKLDEVLVDLAPVQTLLATVKLLTQEVEELRQTATRNKREILSWQMQ